MLHAIDYTLKNFQGTERHRFLMFKSAEEAEAANQALQTVLEDLRGIWTLKALKREIYQIAKRDVDVETVEVPVKKLAKKKVGKKKKPALSEGVAEMV